MSGYCKECGNQHCICSMLTLTINKSKLTYADCFAILGNYNKPFEMFSNDDLDSLYMVAFERKSQYVNREYYIKSLYQKRNELLSKH